MTRTRLYTLALAAALVGTSAVISAENWPQWRGPNSQGVSSETALPTEWGPDRNIAWKTALPDGHSSPSVWGDRIFVTAQVEGDVIAGQIPESVRIKRRTRTLSPATASTR
jgi:outer membrane protein assembly factor BamB